MVRSIVTMVSVALKTVLRETSTKTYFIEYDKFFSNHIAHGLIALDRLGATEERLRRFVKWYDPRLEGPHGSSNIEDKSKSNNDIPSLLGARKNYYTILQYYQTRLDEGQSIDKVIGEEFSKVYDGMACSALHGLIHTGYGMSIADQTLVGEGLAYLYHSYRPFIFSDPNVLMYLPNGQSDILAVLEKVRLDKELHDAMIEGSNDPRWGAKDDTSTFQRRISALSTFHADKILGYVDRINIPANVYDPEIKETSQIIRAARWLMDMVIATYIKTERRNDFFMLHGVTGCWSLLKILPTLDYDVAVKSTKVYLCVLVATYLAQDVPNLTIDLQTNNIASSEDWRAIIEETLSKDRDEHIYKLVQLCHDLALEHEVNDIQKSFYIQAARCALDNPLSFVSKHVE